MRIIHSHVEENERKEAEKRGEINAREKKIWLLDLKQ